MPFITNPFLQALLPILSEKDKSTIMTTLQNSGGFLQVVGECGTGKTILLQYLSKLNSEMPDEFSEYILIYLNCQDEVPSCTSGEFWDKVFVKIEDILADRGDLHQDRSKQGFESFIDLLAQEDKHIVLLLDDFDCLVRVDDQNFDQTRSFLTSLRSITTRQNNKGNLVTASRLNLHRLWEPFAAPGFSDFSNASTYLRLPMSWKEDTFITFLERSQIDDQAMFRRSQMRQIEQLSSCHPKLSQIASSILFEKRIEQGSNLTPEDFDHINFTFYTSPSVTSILQMFWNTTDQEERSLLKLISLISIEAMPELLMPEHYRLGSSTNILETNKIVIDNLVTRGFLVRCQSTIDYRIFLPIFSIWILRLIAQEHPKASEERVIVWKNRLSAEQLRRLGNGIQFLQEHKEMIVSVVSFVQKAVKYLSNIPIV